MYFIGCDLGSTAGKAVLFNADGDAPRMLASAVEPSGFSPTASAQIVIARSCAEAGITPDQVAGMCCTGYGRENVSFITDNVSEISCHAKGARFVCPEVRTIIDVGGQDVKAIALDPSGKMIDFVMNDKCAAGTGKFFEAMARTLRCTVQELGELSLRSTEPVPISSTCSVFAESEVIAYINKDVDRCEIAGGIHQSIARRLNAMVQRVGLAEQVALTGGCAKNPGLRAALERMLCVRLAGYKFDPQMNGAIGATLFAIEHAEGRDA